MIPNIQISQSIHLNNMNIVYRAEVLSPFLRESSTDFEQTGKMSRLIWYRGNKTFFMLFLRWRCLCGHSLN